MGDLVRLVRVKQWTKNLLVYAALLFTGSLTDPQRLGQATLAFVAMCFASAAVYIANDIRDVERDRKHPVKKLRPLAAGTVPYSVAIGLLGTSLAAGIGIAAVVGTFALGLVLTYLAIQTLYNLVFKWQPVADVFCIASGYVLRAILGAVVLSVTVSPWLLFCTGSLALLLGFGKRRHEYLAMGEERGVSRSTLTHYSGPALDVLVSTSAVAAALSYGIYAIDSPTAVKHPGLVVTVVFVFFGIYRYLYLLFAREQGGEPETLLLNDAYMLGSVVLFVITAIWAVNGLSIPGVQGAPGTGIP